jgi:hypothetical protein
LVLARAASISLRPYLVAVSRMSIGSSAERTFVEGIG